MSDTPRTRINKLLDECVNSCIEENRSSAANGIGEILDELERELARYQQVEKGLPEAPAKLNLYEEPDP